MRIKLDTSLDNRSSCEMLSKAFGYQKKTVSEYLFYGHYPTEPQSREIIKFNVKMRGCADIASQESDV